MPVHSERLPTLGNFEAGRGETGNFLGAHTAIEASKAALFWGLIYFPLIARIFKFFFS